MLDIINISESLTVKEYFEKARYHIEDIISRNKVPIVVGGCNFYLNWLIFGIPSTAPPSNKTFAKKIQEKLQQLGWEKRFLLK